MKDLQSLMTAIRQFGDDKFGEGRNPLAELHHLKKEVNELIEAIETNKSNAEVQMEFADCFLLILHSASRHGLSALQLMAAAEMKLEICKNRVWGKPDENGVVHHIEEPAPDKIERLKARISRTGLSMILIDSFSGLAAITEKQVEAIGSVVHHPLRFDKIEELKQVAESAKYFNRKEPEQIRQQKKEFNNRSRHHKGKI